MKMTKLTLCLATLALGVASAASSYTITLTSDVWAGGTQLKAGAYKVQVEGSQVIFTNSKASVPVAVTVEKNASKYQNTMLEADSDNLKAIDFGGTNMKVVFATAKPTGSAASAQ